MYSIVFHTDDDQVPSVIGPFESRELANNAIQSLEDYSDTIYWINIVETLSPHALYGEWEKVNKKAFSEGIRAD